MTNYQKTVINISILICVGYGHLSQAQSPLGFTSLAQAEDNGYQAAYAEHYSYCLISGIAREWVVGWNRANPNLPPVNAKDYCVNYANVKTPPPGPSPLQIAVDKCVSNFPGGGLPACKNNESNEYCKQINASNAESCRMWIIDSIQRQYR